MSIDILSKTPQTTLAADSHLVAASDTGGSPDAKALRISPSAVAQRALSRTEILSGNRTLTSDDVNIVFVHTGSGLVDITLPAGVVNGAGFAFIQRGTGIIRFVAGGGATIHHFQNHNATGGQHAQASLFVTNNVGATAAAWQLAGITAAA